MKHDVVLYAVVCVKVANVEAESQTAAIDKAEREVNLGQLFDQNKPMPGVLYTEFADEVVEYLVDQENDPEFNQSRRYKPGLDGTYLEIGPDCPSTSHA